MKARRISEVIYRTLEYKRMTTILVTGFTLPYPAVLEH
jgi:hypothetical protein